jgi:hypothetical protein
MTTPKHVGHFNDLSSMLEENGHWSKHVRKRISPAKESFMNRRELMMRVLSKNVKKKSVTT